MKYYSLVSLALFGFALAAPAPKPENELLGESFEYVNNEDCYDEEIDTSFQPAEIDGDAFIETEVYNSEECDDEPIEEVDLVDIILPADTDDDLTITSEGEFEGENLVDDYDEDCIEDDFTTEDPPVVETTQGTDEETNAPDCYGEEDFGYEELNVEDQDNYKFVGGDNILGEAEKAHTDNDEIFIETGFSDEGNAEGFEDCLTY